MSGSTQVSGISVPIFAVDHATAVINRVNKSIAGLGSQTSRWSQASSRAGGGAFGLNRLSEGMESLGVRTRDTFRALEKIAPRWRRAWSSARTGARSGIRFIAS